MVNVETMLSYFNQIRKFYANELNERLKGENFSPNEISILILLSNNKTINTSSALRLVLGVSKGLISRSVDNLLKKNMIICIQDQDDKRIQRIKLTEQARPILEKIKKEAQTINKEVLFDIDEKEILQMEETILKILKRINEKECNKNEIKNV
ncbi:MAG: MarR family transcriptional regulator [Erysipelotrichaceae bacterium]|nr:MarR family transcriptional regulator [Erysipelotrichaceae bacterium]